MALIVAVSKETIEKKRINEIPSILDDGWSACQVVKHSRTCASLEKQIR